mmetsp:Transcript_60339/g.70545  ORF Transcript_60339/g.70545 Transcript_60339/m.70545 type:complete len:114 (-) Transcript_60339:285-626(-)
MTNVAGGGADAPHDLGTRLAISVDGGPFGTILVPVLAVLRHDDVHIHGTVTVTVTIRRGLVLLRQVRGYHVVHVVRLRGKELGDAVVQVETLRSVVFVPRVKAGDAGEGLDLT